MGLTLFATNFFGNIAPPTWVSTYGGNSCGGGLIILLTNLFRLGVVVAGLYALINLVLAGFQYISGAGDAKAVGQAGDKITHTLIGLLLVAGSFVLAAIFGLLIFGKADAILKPVIYGPSSVTC
ncbi:MAG: hypothetical protein UW73_C0009G0066 [Microgenomates group bacterium GW2011_GWB1_44_8]|nr:MAG: hypothetical protein UW73_C0009G0066 [Microgenomates group bacterium GW2011_GWB1_44_8]